MDVLVDLFVLLFYEETKYGKRLVSKKTEFKMNWLCCTSNVSESHDIERHRLLI